MRCMPVFDYMPTLQAWVADLFSNMGPNGMLVLYMTANVVLVSPPYLGMPSYKIFFGVRDRSKN